MPESNKSREARVQSKAKTGLIQRLAVFDALANPILGISNNLFETGKAVFDAALGKMTYGLEILSDSLTKLSVHSRNMGIASAALNGISTVLLSPLSLYFRYKNKQKKQESFSWHTKAKFIYGLLVFAATIFAMAFPPAAIAINIVLACTGVISSGVSLFRNIKRRIAAGDAYRSGNLEPENHADGEQSGLMQESKYGKTPQAPDNSKIAHKIFGALLSVAGVVAVGLAASGGGLLVAAGIMAGVIAVLSTIQLFTKIGEAIYKAYTTGDAKVELVNNPVPEPTQNSPRVQAQVTQDDVLADDASTLQTISTHQDVKTQEETHLPQKKERDPASPSGDSSKPVPTPAEIKQALHELKPVESTISTGLSGLGRVRF